MLLGVFVRWLACLSPSRSPLGDSLTRPAALKKAVISLGAQLFLKAPWHFTAGRRDCKQKPPEPEQCRDGDGALDGRGLMSLLGGSPSSLCWRAWLVGRQGSRQGRQSGSRLPSWRRKVRVIRPVADPHWLLGGKLDGLTVPASFIRT